VPPVFGGLVAACFMPLRPQERPVTALLQANLSSQGGGKRVPGPPAGRGHLQSQAAGGWIMEATKLPPDCCSRSAGRSRVRSTAEIVTARLWRTKSATFLPLRRCRPLGGGSRSAAFGRNAGCLVPAPRPARHRKAHISLSVAPQMACQRRRRQCAPAERSSLHGIRSDKSTSTKDTTLPLQTGEARAQRRRMTGSCGQWHPFEKPATS
jgi:hypothetical protein